MKFYILLGLRTCTVRQAINNEIVFFSLILGLQFIRYWYYKFMFNIFSLQKYWTELNHNLIFPWSIQPWIWHISKENVTRKENINAWRTWNGHCNGRSAWREYRSKKNLLRDIQRHISRMKYLKCSTHFIALPSSCHSTLPAGYYVLRVTIWA